MLGAAGVTRAGRSYDPVKRLLDVLVAGALLVLTAPVQAVVALLVRRGLGSPVLFRQPRPGKDGEVFDLVKFRTMAEPDPSRSLVTDAERLTPFGTLAAQHEPGRAADAVERAAG